MNEDTVMHELCPYCLDILTYNPVDDEYICDECRRTFEYDAFLEHIVETTVL